MSSKYQVEPQQPPRLSRSFSKSLSRMADAPATANPCAVKAPTNDMARRESSAPVGEPLGQEIWPLPGLAPMTRVRTIFGDVHSIALRKGDEVLTRAGEYLPILWIKRIRLDEHILNSKPDSNPVVIGAGALGNSGELMVSPRQMIGADDANGLNKAREASMLISHAGVRRLRESGLTYTMFHVGQDVEVFCEGLYLSFPLEA